MLRERSGPSFMAFHDVATILSRNVVHPSHSDPPLIPGKRRPYTSAVTNLLITTDIIPLTGMNVYSLSLTPTRLTALCHWFAGFTCIIFTASSVIKHILHSLSRVRKVAETAYWIRHIHLSACTSAAPTGRIYVQFGIGDFCENLSKNSKFG